MTHTHPIVAQSILEHIGINNLLLVAGLMLVLTSLMWSIRRRQRRGGQTLTAPEQIEKLKQARGVRGDLEELMVEVEQMAKRLSAQIDSKTIEIEQLLDRAERTLAELRNLRQPPAPGTAPLKTGPSGPDSSHPSTPPPTPGIQPDPPASARTATPTPPPGATASAVTARPDPPIDPLTRRIYELADQGRSPLEIARALQEHVGKIELILALRQV